MVVIEQTEAGGFLVYRVFPCAASAQAGAVALERVVPEGYKPGSLTPTRLCGIAAYDGHPFNPPSTEDGS